MRSNAQGHASAYPVLPIAAAFPGGWWRVPWQVVADQLRTLNWWGVQLNIAPNTLRNWRDDESMPVVRKGKRSFIAESDLRAFLVTNTHLPAASKALAALESATGAQPTGSTSATLAPDDDLREEVRRLRARVATLDAELDRERTDSTNLRASRDVWRARARAHRETLRRQLDLEELADARDAD